ncbi:hypothetical protein [Halobacteriovorax sp. HLS]|nr:hypothetical protein [Halobacteriovorax sp. HLS]
MEIVIIAGVLLGSMIAIEVKRRQDQEKNLVPVKVRTKSKD